MNQSLIRYKWNEISWRKLQRNTFKLQKRIYQASQDGDIKRMRHLQKLLLSSKSAKLLSVRKVTQDNRGKKTAGVDGVKSLKPNQRLDLVEAINLHKRAKPVRRIMIPKTGNSEMRPLGIPTIEDRIKQALVKMVIEPEWEAKFEPNSYGFRPGRSCHDVYGAIFGALTRKKAYVLDADISGCFDNIDHKALLEKLNTIPTARRNIKSWLEAGVMENNTFYKNDKGTPQGGVISPLLANVALHGLEYDTKEALSNDLFQYLKEKKGKASIIESQQMMSVIRYADDFVIIHENKDIVMKAKSFVEKWLSNIGLTLKKSKTRISHTFKVIKGLKPGFDFLGFTIRQFSVNCNKQGYKLLIKPSRKAQKNHMLVIREKLRKMRGETQATVIRRLNPIIKGWSRYYVPAVSRKVFERQSHLMHCKLWKWALWKHPHKGQRWIKRKYFREHGGDKWRFMTHKNEILVRHSDYNVKRHVKVIGTKSPYDGNFVYWAKRMGRSLDIPQRVAQLLKKQHGKCIECRFWFNDTDRMEVHHNDWNRHNNSIDNLVLLHGHCHDHVHKVRYV